jgi:hypothetical protein
VSPPEPAVEPTGDPPVPATPATPQGDAGEKTPRRRPGRFRRFLVRPFVWGFVLLASVLVGFYYLIGSALVHRRFAAFAITQAADFFNRKVTVARVDYSLFPLAVELRGVVVAGATPREPPFATAELLNIQIPWSYLRQRIVRLDQIDAIHPTLYLEFRPDGTNNLPQFRHQGGNGQSSVQLQIGRLIVQRGEFRLNQRKVTLDISARSIWGRLSGPRPSNLEGMATAQDVVTSLPNGKPYPVTVSGKVTLLAGRSLLRINAARVRGADLQASAVGWVGWQAAPRVEIRFDAAGDSRLVNHLGYLDAPITGPFKAAAGRFSLNGDDWGFSGVVNAPRVDFLGRTATNVVGSAKGDSKRVHVDVLRATYAGGAAAGKVDVDYAKIERAGQPVALDFNFRGVSIATALAAEKVPIQGLSGEGSGSFLYRFVSGSPLKGSGRANVTLSGQYAGKEPATGLAVSGTVPLVFERGVLKSPGFALAGPGQNATGTLLVDLPTARGQVDFQLLSQDAGAVMRLLPIAPDKTGKPAFWQVTAGHGQATGSLGFSPAGLVIDLGLDLADVRSPEPAIVADTVHGGLRVAPRAVENLHLDLTRGRGRLAVSGRIPIPGNQAGDRPKVPLSDPLTLVVDATEWPAASVAAYLSPSLPVTITGLASGRVDLGGSTESLSGTASARVADLAVDGFPLGQATAGLTFAGTTVKVENGILDAPSGRARVAGSFDTTAETLAFTVDAPALSLAAPPFRDLLPDTTGTFALNASVDGTLDRPQVKLTARGQSLALAGQPLGEGGDIGKAELQASWDGATVHASGSLLGLLHFDGGGRLDPKGSELAFDLKSDNLPGLARLAAGTALPAFKGTASGRMTATADFTAHTYRAELTLPALALEYGGRKIQNAEPVVVDLDPQRVVVRSLSLREPEHQTLELTLVGSIGITGAGAKASPPLDLRVQGTVWAGWAKIFAPDLDFDGYVDTLAAVRGTLKDPAVSGEAVLRDAKVIVPGLPSTIDKLSGEVRFSGDQVVIDNLVSQDFAGGTVRVAGSLTLPKPGKPFTYRAQLSAQGISLRYPEGFVNHGNADLTLTPSEGGGRLLRGTVTLDRIYYLENVPVATLDIVKKLFQRSRLQVAPTNGFLASTQVNIVIAGPEALRVHNNLADLHGDVNLTLRGNLARPVVLGSVQIDPGGKLVYSDNEYRVERGTLTFDDAYKIDPVIDVVVRTRVRDFDITVNFSGTLERLSTNFSSNANLADLEILTLLATGQELSEADRLRALSTPPGQTVQTQQSVTAGSFLAGQAASAIGQRVGSLFGFDRFRINPIAAETGQSVGGVGFTVGKRLSKDVFVTYSTDPTASRQNVLQVEWRVGRNVTLLLTQTTNKGYAVDTRWERRF